MLTVQETIDRNINPYLAYFGDLISKPLLPPPPPPPILIAKEVDEVAAEEEAVIEPKEEEEVDKVAAKEEAVIEPKEEVDEVAAEEEEEEEEEKRGLLDILNRPLTEEEEQEVDALAGYKKEDGGGEFAFWARKESRGISSLSPHYNTDWNLKQSQIQHRDYLINEIMVLYEHEDILRKNPKGFDRTKIDEIFAKRQVREQELNAINAFLL